mgnify:CR=1 FL=1|tara:strand:+ start:398 stop:658 length:261 start_codon:yes stop_codon:yes gene_type:complete
MNKDIIERLDIIEKAIAVIAEQQKAFTLEAGLNFILIDDILEAHSECLEMLIEESPDLEMIFAEEDEEPKSATILTLVVDNTKDEE